MTSNPPGIFQVEFRELYLRSKVPTSIRHIDGSNVEIGVSENNDTVLKVKIQMRERHRLVAYVLRSLIGVDTITSRFENE